MSLLTILIVLVVVGLLLYVVNEFVPMQPTIKQILNVVLILVVVLWLLREFGVLAYISHIKI